MSEYTNYVMRQMGLKEGTFNPKSEEEDPIDSMGDKSSALQKLSPTAKATPVIGIAVRGSVSGGLPGGGKAPANKYGGYTPVNLEKPNSELVDNTPKTSVIQNKEPKVPEGSMPTTPGNTHPHQTQKNSDEPPQTVTGGEETAKQDSNIKPSEKDGKVEIEVQEQGQEELPKGEEAPRNHDLHESISFKSLVKKFKK